MEPGMPDDGRSDRPTFENLRDAASRWFDGLERVEPVGSAPHLSRVTANGIEYVMRQWPLGARVEAVNLASRALDIARPACDGRLPVPQPGPGEPDSWGIRVGERLVSAATWLPGRPLARYGDFRTPDGAVIDVPLPPSAPAPEIVLEAVRTIGAFHAATAPLATTASMAASTLPKLLRESSATWSAQRRDVGQRAANSPEIRRWLRCGNRVYPVAAEYLEPSAAGASTTIIHGDIWPANLLIEGHDSERTLSGIVGWSQVRVGSPLIDLAHLAIHTAGWSGALAESILGAYTEVAPLPPMERRVLPVVAALDLVPRVGRLLDLAFVDDRMIGHESQPVLRSGLKSLLTSLENLTQILAPEPDWRQRKAGEHRRTREESARGPGERGTRPARPPGSTRSRPGSRPGRRTRG